MHGRSLFFTPKQVSGPSYTAESHPIWIKFFTHVLLYGILPAHLRDSSLSLSSFRRHQGRSQPRSSGGAPASGRWARGWLRTNVSPSAAGTLGIFFVYFKYKILHSDAFFGSENGYYQCFIKTPVHWGNEDCWKRLPNEARRAENGGRRPRAGWGTPGGAASPTSSEALQ